MTNGSAYEDFTFSSKFDVKITPLDPVLVQSILQEFEKKLHSGDPDVRHDALDVLSSTAPDYFQDIALTISRSKDAFAVLHAIGALERINTPETRAALADLLTAEEPKSDDEILVRIHAIEALGHNGDATYQTIVGRYLADRDQHIQLNAMAAIAQLGKAEAVPQLQRFFFNPNPVVRKNVAAAMRFSLTPEAVEALINSIPDKDPSVREQILTSLTRLTGYSVANSTPERVQSAWRAWWRDNKGKLPFPEHLTFLCHLK
jgi:HEAT repeat protein